MDAHTATQALERYLSATQEFITLKKTQAEIRRNPETNALISQFQSKQNALRAQKPDASQIQRHIDELDSAYQHLRGIPAIAQYFQAVDQFNVVLNRTMNDLNAALEHQMDDEAVQ